MFSVEVSAKLKSYLTDYAQHLSLGSNPPPEEVVLPKLTSAEVVWALNNHLQESEERQHDLNYWQQEAQRLRAEEAEGRGMNPEQIKQILKLGGREVQQAVSNLLSDPVFGKINPQAIPFITFDALQTFIRLNEARATALLTPVQLSNLWDSYFRGLVSNKRQAFDFINASRAVILIRPEPNPIYKPDLSDYTDQVNRSIARLGALQPDYAGIYDALTLKWKQSVLPQVGLKFNDGR